MAIMDSKADVWKVLPLALFSAVTLFGYRYCNSMSDERRTSTDVGSVTPSPIVPSAIRPDTSRMVKDAAARTMAALGGLTARSSAEDLVDALNLNIINFAEGSSVIPADQDEVLTKAAEAIKAAPAGTRL